MITNNPQKKLKKQAAIDKIKIFLGGVAHESITPTTEDMRDGIQPQNMEMISINS